MKHEKDEDIDSSKPIQFNDSTHKEVFGSLLFIVVAVILMLVLAHIIGA